MTCFRMKNGKTVHKWCKENNVCYDCFWRRAELGISTEEACKQAVKASRSGYSHPRIFYKGTPLCKIFKAGTLKYDRVIRRLHRGMTIEQAMEGV